MSARLRSRRAAPDVLLMTAALHVLALLAFGAASLFDGRTVLSEPVWLKPSKFAASIATYLVTLHLMLRAVPGRPRLLGVVRWGSALGLCVEMVLIATQAGRGVRSHFNTAQLLDAAIFTTMGITILGVWVLGFLALRLLWRASFASRALGLAVRGGLLLSLVGAGLGGLMTRPHPAQLEEARREGRPPRVTGGHAVGASDADPGLPLSGWSRTGGDLRVPHFVGLHAMQALPALALLLRRRRMEEARQWRWMRVATAGYLGAIGVLLLQALRGESVASPSLYTLGTALAVAVVLTAWSAWLRRRASLHVPVVAS